MQVVTQRANRRLLRQFTRHQRDILALLLYALVAVAMTWPAAARLRTHLAGGRWDILVHQWTFWWVKQSIIDGFSPFYTNLLYHPVGVSLASHNIAWLNIALWLPLQAIVGSYTAYSLLFIGVFALNGFAMYLLGRDWTGSSLAGFIAGLIYGFWPYTLSHSDHPNMVFIAWVPLALLYLRRTLERGLKRDAVLTGFFLALIGLTRWQLLIMGGIIIGLYLLFKCLTEKGCRSRRTLGRLGLAGLVAVVLMAPLAAPVLAAQLSRPYPEDAILDHAEAFPADLLGYLLPSHYHPVWGDAVGPLYKDFDVDATLRVAFLGYTAIALAFYGAVKQWRSATFWILAAGVYLMLALGPELVINGRAYPQVPMPYRLVEDLFLIRVVYRPHRFNLLLGLPVGMLAALGVAALLRRWRGKWRAALLVAVLGGLILFEYCPIPYFTMNPATPDWYHQLAEEPDDFAVLDLPMHPRGYDKWYMLYQITHGKSLVEGHVSRIPREAYGFLDSTPFLKRLREDNVMDPALVDITNQLRPLAEADVRYVVLHKRFASADQLAAWRDWLTFEPHYEDAEVVVYRTDPRLGRDFALAHEMTDEIGLVRAGFTVEEPVKAGSSLIRVDARWGSTAPPGRDYDVCLNLVSAGGKVAQSDCRPLSLAWPSSRWEANELVRSEYTLLADPFLETGAHTLTLTLADHGSEAEVGSPAVLGTVEVEALPRVFAEPSPAHLTDAQWGDVILLHGYDLETLADSLELTLYWEARQRMGASYKIFVHLMDVTTGDTVVQNDAEPCQWTCPTHWWERGQVVEDTVVLGLDGVSPGRYRLVVGLYDPETGVRLPAYSVDGERYQEDAVPVTTVER